MKEDFTRIAISDSSLSMLISAARRQIKHTVAAMSQPYGLNPYQYWMFLIIKQHGAMSLSELAGRMWMDHPTTSRLVHAMEDQGLLQIQPDPKHGRRVLIGLNPDKTPILEELHGKVSAYQSRLEAGLSDEEKTNLVSGLGKVIRNLTGVLNEMKSGKGSGERAAKAETLAS